MIGIKNYDFRLHRGILENFLELARTGKTLNNRGEGHRDGWGAGYYAAGTASLRKSGKSAVTEKTKILGLLGKIRKSKVLIVHLRDSAWPGTNSARNSHPFECNNVIFAHNGTIRNYKKLLKDVSPTGKSVCMPLDSEAFLLHIMKSGRGKISRAFRRAVSGIKKNNKYTSLTCVFSDGKKLFAYREYTRRGDYYTLYRTDFKNSVIVCSEPVSDELKWKLLAKNELFAA